MNETEIVIRLSVAALAGMLLGADRELRGISAGIRTHGLVSLSSAVTTMSALLLYYTLRGEDGNYNIDPLRVIQGLAQAIGFIAAGAIFFSKGDVHNLTSAATIWLAAAVGIAAGAGQFFLLGTALVMGVILITTVRIIERMVPGSTKEERE